MGFGDCARSRGLQVLARARPPRERAAPARGAKYRFLATAKSSMTNRPFDAAAQGLPTTLTSVMLECRIACRRLMLPPMPLPSPPDVSQLPTGFTCTASSVARDGGRVVSGAGMHRTDGLLAACSL